MSAFDDPQDYAEALAWFNECKARRVRDKERLAELEAENERLQGELNIIERNNVDHIATALDTNEALYRAEAELAALKEQHKTDIGISDHFAAELAALRAENLDTVEMAGQAAGSLMAQRDLILAALAETKIVLICRSCGRHNTFSLAKTVEAARSLYENEEES